MNSNVSTQIKCCSLLMNSPVGLALRASLLCVHPYCAPLYSQQDQALNP